MPRCSRSWPHSCASVANVSPRRHSRPEHNLPALGHSTSGRDVLGYPERHALAMGKLPPDLAAEGFTFDGATRVLRIRHTSARDIDIQGKGGGVPPH